MIPKYPSIFSQRKEGFSQHWHSASNPWISQTCNSQREDFDALWMYKLDCDKVVTDKNVLQEWNIFREYLSILAQFETPRSLVEKNLISNIEHHGFAGLYVLRSIYEDNYVYDSPISVKSKVGSIKVVTLPRL